MQLIDGKATAAAIKAEIAEEVKGIMVNGGKQPHLAAVLVGHDGGSETYVKNKVLAWCHRFAHDIASAQYDTLLATCLNIIALEQSNNAQWCGRNEARQSNSHTSYVDGMESIHILSIVDGFNHFLLINMFGQWQLYNESIYIGIFVQPIDTLQQFLFNRINGEWMMTSINYKPMYSNMNASFLKFYGHFATDSTFQAEHLHNPVKFVGPDPDDDFSTMSGDIEPETWPAFAPQLPHGMIYNIIYGQKYAESNQKIFVIRGIANGMETILTFKRIHGKWMLIKLNM